MNVWQVYFDSEEVCACIVTCGGLCPGLNTVIREIVCGLYHMYGVHNVMGIEVSFMYQLTSLLYVSVFITDKLGPLFAIFEWYWIVCGEGVSLKCKILCLFKCREDIQVFILETQFL